MHLLLEGKRLAVTGGSVGIGRATAALAVAEGAIVATVSRSEQGPGVGEALHVSADLFHAGQPERALQEIDTILNGIDILINNVGLAVIRDFMEVTDEQWTLSFNANFLSAVRATSAVLPAMVRRGLGTIVFVTSTSGVRPSLRMPDYSITKASLLAYSKAIADVYRTQGIRSNAVIPGPTLTRAWLGTGGLAEQQGDRDEVLAKAAAARTLGRFADPEEIANVIVFLASDASGNLSGAEWSVSGGTVP